MATDPNSPYVPQQPASPPPPLEPTYSQEPVTLVPVGQYPTTVTPPPLPARRTSLWTWAFAIVTILLLAGGAGMGVLYSNALRGERARVASLEETIVTQATTIAERDSTIRARDSALAEAEADLATAQDCVDAVRQALEAPTDVEFEVAYDRMVGLCL
jgi:hypothetical protein